MRKKVENPVGTPCKRGVLSSIYRRQFNELAPLRKYILSLLPLDTVNTIFEPGCGTGLLGREFQKLTDAVYTGMDIDECILAPGKWFTQGNAEKVFPEVDLYATGFFFSSIENPVRWLKKLNTRLFSVFSEYDYMRIEEKPEMNVAHRLRTGLQLDGLHTCHGGRLDEYFSNAGYAKMYGGDAGTDFQMPDREFLKMHIPDLTGEIPLMSWRIVWGIWRKR